MSYVLIAEQFCLTAFRCLIAFVEYMRVFRFDMGYSIVIILQIKPILYSDYKANGKKHLLTLRLCVGILRNKVIN